MNRLHSFLLFATIAFVTGAFVTGCGGTSSSPVDVTPTPPPAAKAMLDAIAESGELGSDAMGLREAIEASPDSASLLPDLDKLEAAATPEEVKSIAKRMAGKL